jgi:hypothetical protein
MDYIEKCYITLDSMGDELDFLMEGACAGVGFTPSAGSLVYNPQSNTIDTYLSLNGDSWTISSRPVNGNDIYFNLRTGRAYTWDGSAMVNAHLAPDVNGVVPSTSVDFSQPYSSYVVSTEICGQTIDIGRRSSIYFYGNGRFVNCKLIGSELTVIPNGTQQIFNNCTFRLREEYGVEFLFVDCRLYATNFGAISDMHTEDKVDWRFRGVIVDNLRVHRGRTLVKGQSVLFSGSINDTAWAQLAAFLKNSYGVKIEFNGKFMGNTVENIIISDCKELELYGGTMLRGFELVDCQYVDIHDMRFVGVHEVHDFPTIYHQKSAHVESMIQNGASTDAIESFISSNYDITYPGDNVQIDLEGKIHKIEQGDAPVELGVLISCGLSGDGIKVRRDLASFADCYVTIHDCHFEMRQSGVSFSSLYLGLPVNQVKPLSYATVYDCSFSHIYYQPIGLHAEHVTIENIESDYCMQGLDISTCANNTVARNCVFKNCACGPKQETFDPYTELSHNNIIENCHFQITNDYNLTNTSRFILVANKGLSEDTFVIRNCEFVINCTERCVGMQFRSWRTVLKNIKFKIDIDRGDATDYDILFLIGIGGATPHSPIVEIDHVDIECNARIDSLVFRGVGSNAGALNVQMKYFNLYGTGRATQLFERVSQLSLDNCRFNLASNSFIRYSYRVNIKKCQVAQISSSCIIAYTITNVNYLIEESAFDVGSHFLWIQATGGSICLRNNMIKSSTFVACKWDGSAIVDIVNNDITDVSSSGSLLFCAAPGQSYYDFWADGGTNDLCFRNNVVHFQGNGIKKVVYSAMYPNYAHLFYCNFLCSNVKQMNTGSVDERPTTPWQGMLHIENGVYYVYDQNDGWA